MVVRRCEFEIVMILIVVTDLRYLENDTCCSCGQMTGVVANPRGHEPVVSSGEFNRGCLDD